MKIIDIFTNHPRLSEDDYGTDKGTIHSYIETYERLLSPFQKKPITLLEIGIQRGGSLFLWSKFFHTDSKIYGIDIDLNNLKPEWVDSNIEYVHHNAYDINFTYCFNELFDIIIDDGPHSVESFCFLAKYYIEKLKPGGILIIEDIQNIQHIEIIKNIIPTIKHQNIEIVDLRHIKNRYDDILFIYRNL